MVKASPVFFKQETKPESLKLVGSRLQILHIYLYLYLDLICINKLAIALGINIAQKPYIVWSLGPTALIYESLDS